MRRPVDFNTVQYQQCCMGLLVSVDHSKNVDANNDFACELAHIDLH